VTKRDWQNSRWSIGFNPFERESIREHNGTMLRPKAVPLIYRTIIRHVVRLTAGSMLLCAAWGQSPFRYQEVMVPMRDGVHLQTVILTPVGMREPLPILLQRTPYGVPEKAPETIPPNLQELTRLCLRPTRCISAVREDGA
jgi:predicted acyl esterase